LGKRAKQQKTRGLGLVYQPKYVDPETGKRKTAATWWIQFYVRGVRYRESSRSTNRADAVRLLKHRLSEAAAGKPVGIEVERTTFEELVRILLDDYQANERRSLRRVTGGVKHLREFFGDYRAIDITDDRINAYIVHRKEQGAANATINRELAALKRAFRLAGRKAGTPPRFQMLRENNTRKGFFEAEQFQAVLKHLPDELKPVFQVAYITGWRVPSEILTRRWQHVDFEGNWLRLEPGETKNEEGRMFPLIPELREILAAQRERTRQLELVTGRVIPWVFHRDGKPIKDYYTGWDKACRLAGYPDRVPHDLRRTAVRNLERAGVSRSAAMKMTGHKTESIYRRYAIVDEAMLREGAEKLAVFHDAAKQNARRRVVPLRTRDVMDTPQKSD
jgi:integrase